MAVEKKYWVGFSKRNILAFFVISLVPLIIWSLVNYFLVRTSYSDLTIDLLESKRNQFNRNVSFILAELDSIPDRFDKISPAQAYETVKYLSHSMRTSLYLRKDGQLTTFNWNPELRSSFTQPFTYDPVLSLASYLHIEGNDTLLIAYSVADLLRFSGISDTLLTYREKVAYLDPLGQVWDLPDFPPLFLKSDRLVATENEIFSSFNYVGWSFPLLASPNREDGGNVIIAFDRAELFGKWTTYQYYFPIGVIILFIIIVWSGTFVGLRVGKALRRLLISTKALGSGKFDVPIRIEGTKEIVELSRALEDMRIKLKDIYENQEEVVNKRTRDLQEAQFQIVHQEKMASIGLFAAGIAHEIGNPLTSISSIVQVLKRKNKDEKTAEFLDTIHDNIQRISKIVRELVDFSRPSRHELNLTNVNNTVNSAVGITKYDKRASDIDFYVKLDKDLPEILIVEDQLMQVFVNILVNSTDAIVKDPKRIEVWTYASENNVFVEFHDSGNGIRPEDQQKIFEPFYTTKEVGKGTGLGLSVSYGIIQNFGGEIKVKSKPGDGSVFTIILPVEKDKEINTKDR